MSLGPQREGPVEAATMRRVTLRIVPFLMFCYFIAFVDRVNAGFAASR
jgi:ACS family tartrate transporter-like MFS transporter